MENEGSFLDRIYAYFNEMDFKGQARAENIYHLAVGVGAVICFVFGYIYQDFGLAVKLELGIALFVMLVCIPAWPTFKKDEIKWLQPYPKEDVEMKEK